ncbi:MAG TPA: hypothetical protein VJW20_07430 [Candidatus Angelobacter sp.]|nr:hypothetical protein [Candidatus Angelobacter sp.]
MQKYPTGPILIFLEMPGPWSNSDGCVCMVFLILFHSINTAGNTSCEQKKFVAYGHGDQASGFWAYDVALNVFLKHLIDAGKRTGEHSMALQCHLMIGASHAFPDYGLTPRLDMADGQGTDFLALAELAPGLRSEMKESSPGLGKIFCRLLLLSCSFHRHRLFFNTFLTFKTCLTGVEMLAYYQG